MGQQYSTSEKTRIEILYNVVASDTWVLTPSSVKKGRHFLYDLIFHPVHHESNDDTFRKSCNCRNIYNILLYNRCRLQKHTIQYYVSKRLMGTEKLSAFIKYQRYNSRGLFS